MEVNKYIWKAMTMIRDTVLENNGFIYGGFVRDSIIHDHFAQEFYKHTHSSDEANDDYIKKYADPTFHPETWGRTHIPKDMDIYMHESDYAKLADALNKKRLFVRKIFTRDPKQYLPNFNNQGDPTVRHTRLVIKPSYNKLHEELGRLPIDTSAIKHLLPNIYLPAVQVDVITSAMLSKCDPFFGMPDFECNALYMTKHGISVCKSFCCGDVLRSFEIINRIMKDIIKKHAQSVSHCGYRVKKFLDDGWSIGIDDMMTINDPSYEGYCIICHDNVPDIHFKLKCCDCRYHIDCLRKTIANAGNLYECILCKKPCNLGPKHSNVLFEVHELNDDMH